MSLGWICWGLSLVIWVSVQCRMLRSVHMPRMWLRWAGESPGAPVSPLVNPMRVSLTSGEGGVRVPSFQSKPAVDPWLWDAWRGCGRVLKRGRALGGLGVSVGVSGGGGKLHSVSPACSRMTWIGRWRPVRCKYASSNSSLGIRFCQMRVGRCAPEPHLGALRTVDGHMRACAFGVSLGP